MNLISIIAETFNFIILHFCALVHNFLQVNFTIVSFIIKYFEYLKGTLVVHIFSFLNILKCYYQDFVVFLYEVISLMQFFMNIISNFLYKVYLQVIYIVFTMQECVHTIQQNILSFYMFIQFCGQQMYEIISYLLQLIITSTLLLLQLGPNLLILSCEVILCCLWYILTLSKYFGVTFVENLYNICCMSKEAIFSIPMKAYFGALLCIALYYQRKNMYAFFKQCFVHTTFTVFHSGRLLSTWLKSIFNILACIFSKAVLFFYPEETNTYTSNTDDLNSEQAKPLQKNFLQKHLQEMKNLYSKFSSSNHCIEEQIKQLQNELMTEREKHICVICFDRPRSVVFYPCQHLCLCDECSINLTMSLHRCPICRSNVTDVHHVFT